MRGGYADRDGQPGGRTIGGLRGKRESPEGALAEASTLSGLSSIRSRAGDPTPNGVLADGRSLRQGCDPKIAPSRLREGSAGRETRHPGTARRSRRIPVRHSERPRCPRSPDGSGSRSTASERLSPLRASWLGPPPGFPYGVAGKVDRRPRRGNSKGWFFFARRVGCPTANGPASCGPYPLSVSFEPNHPVAMADGCVRPAKEQP
jgi:hypothetical protein